MENIENSNNQIALFRGKTIRRIIYQKEWWFSVIDVINVLTGTDCADTETIFRIIQSIPSPNAEPFKRWLAKIGYERIQEIENPELATKRTKMLYKLKRYSDDWIEKRM